MNSMDEFLEYVQEINPLWSVVLVAIALAILLVAKLWSGSFLRIAAGALILAVALAIAAGGYFAYAYFEDLRRLEERRALEARAEALFQKTVEADSVFACVDGSPVPAMLEACERSLFSDPARVAAAVAIVTQRLVFLNDAVTFVETRDPSYAERIEPLRNAVEADPYGFVAFVLSVEHLCTPDACSRFRLLRDPTRVRENMRVRRLEAYMAKHSTTWRGSSELPDDTLPAVGGRTTSPLVTISGEPVMAPTNTDATPPAEVPAAAAARPVTIPEEMVIAPMITPPSVATVAAEPPAAAAAPPVTPPAAEGFAEPPRPVEPVAATPAAGDAAKGAARAAGQAKAKAKAKAADPAARRSTEPVAGLPRVVPSDYIREQEEEKEAAAAQSAAPPPGAPTPIAPPLQQNFIDR
jgi:hypothetical protein